MNSNIGSNELRDSVPFAVNWSVMNTANYRGGGFPSSSFYRISCLHSTFCCKVLVKEREREIDEMDDDEGMKREKNDDNLVKGWV